MGLYNNTATPAASGTAGLPRDSAVGGLWVSTLPLPWAGPPPAHGTRPRHSPRVDAALPGPPPRTAGLMRGRGTQGSPPGTPEVHTIRTHAKHVRTAQTRRAAPGTRHTRATEPDPTVVLLEQRDSKQTQLAGSASSHGPLSFNRPRDRFSPRGPPRKLSCPASFVCRCTRPIVFFSRGLGAPECCIAATVHCDRRIKGSATPAPCMRARDGTCHPSHGT